MPKFRKKPVTIEAVHFLGRSHDSPVFGETRPKWLREALAKDRNDPGAVWFDAGWSPPCVMIFTLEGVMRVEPGGWIIRGVKGELYPCSPEIFDQTYEQVED